MKARFALALLLGMSCSLVGVGDAQAQYGFNGCGYGGWGAFDVGRLYGVLANNVPYYAAFPPVYYSGSRTADLWIQSVCLPAGSDDS